ncbi:bifunctional adenosylcobinamide kinase/adenosylcobinamide-phosphate guanylyltransferase [Actinomadura graeca]|uniref:bifunctional adenosylcobinamide kinase/adenosylcobinamide-phosphate guanylyltransferase n=1 Tax=Actinomadura graeca TaxID=2750812 RepID=UPI001E5D00E7|nr:bifunctional adenosylcobinamide kinase/adenosylcobinamide-phosphate guanylyltransferase [Actinomadura graeca]
MDIELRAFAGPRGWPATGCVCASCNRLRLAGIRHEPASVVIDGVPLEDCARVRVPGGHDVTGAGGGRALVASGPGAAPEPAAGVEYDAVLLDLAGSPEHLGRLRHVGAATPKTEVMAVHVDHRISSPAELERRMAFWERPQGGPSRTLLLGGTRSGKSAEAELRLAACPDVTYVATGLARDDDPEWNARIAAHRGRRPAWWRTVETTDLPGALAAATGAVLVDGIGTWLTAAIDEAGAWDDPSRVRPRLEEVVAAWRGTRARVVAVSDEVGLSLVPATPSGRAFRDLLGHLNQRLAAESEEAALVVAGRVMDLP